MINSIANAYKKELKNTDPEELNNSLLVDIGPNIIGKKNLKRHFINYRFKNNSNKQWDKRYYESNKVLRKILLVKKEDFSIFLDHQCQLVYD